MIEPAKCMIAPILCSAIRRATILSCPQLSQGWPCPYWLAIEVLIRSSARLAPATPLDATKLSRSSRLVHGGLRYLRNRQLALVHEALHDDSAALASMRIWQRLHVERSELASRARYQAAALQTELLRLQHKLDENVARRRAIERRDFGAGGRQRHRSARAGDRDQR